MKSYILVLFFAMTAAFSAQAQVKIGYTNVEYVLAFMPQAKAMEGQLQTYQKKLGEKLQVKDAFVKQKYQEYLQEKERGAADERLKVLEGELVKLDGEIQKEASDAEMDLLAKQQELMEPILKKLQDAIDGVAADQGYTYILNQTTSAGVSTILYGPDEADVTEELFKRLGIALPKE